jgi:hypothetical protein
MGAFGAAVIRVQILDEGGACGAQRDGRLLAVRWA